MGHKSRCQLALETFEQTADALDLPSDVRDMLIRPEQVLETGIAVEMDGGGTRQLQAFRAQHNTALGPAKGGIRCQPNITLDEVQALAMRFTWRWALLDIPLGGGECGIAVNPEELSQAELRQLADCAAMKDVPLTGAERALCANRGAAAPEALAGGFQGWGQATGRGVFHMVAAACEHLRIPLRSARIAVQGFGCVGSAAALILAEAGAVVIAAGDSQGAIYAARGLDVPKLARHKERSGSVVGFVSSEPITDCELLALDCDVLVEAALGNAIHCRNVPAVQARIIAEASNAPVTPAADRILEAKGAFLIPDILCNAGGPVASYHEWLQGFQLVPREQADLRQTVERVMRRSFQDVVKMSGERGVSMRKAAHMLAVSRVAAAVEQPVLQS
jgi:glutamate dehydrogenase/leucine dehydrogenase